MSENTVVSRLAAAAKHWRNSGLHPQAIVAEAALGEIRRLEARIAELQELHPTVEAALFRADVQPLVICGAGGESYRLSALESLSDLSDFDDGSYSASYLTACDKVGQQFSSWLVSTGSSLATVFAASYRPDVRPLFDVQLVEQWVVSRSADAVSASVLKRNVSSLSVWLRRQGWDVSSLDSSSDSGRQLRAVIDGLSA